MPVDHSEVARRFGEPIYGLEPQWRGTRLRDGHGGRVTLPGAEPELEFVRVRHIPVDSPRASIEVSTIAGSAEAPLGKITLGWLMRAVGMVDGGAREWMPQFPVTVTADAWDGFVTIKDERRPVTVVGEPGHWTFRVVAGQCNVQVWGHEVPFSEMRLVPVDLADYIDPRDLGRQ